MAQAVEPGRLVGGAQGGRRDRREHAVVASVDRSPALALRVGLEPLLSELPDRLEHVEQPRVGIDPHQQARVDQRGQLVEQLTVAEDALDGLEVGGAVEHRKPCEEVLLLLSQLLVAPGDGVAQRALPRRRVAGSAGEQRQAAVHALEEGGGRQRAQASRRQLDGEGQPVDAPADLDDGLQVLFVEFEVGADVLGPRHEQLDAAELQGVLDAHAEPGIGQLHRGDGEGNLTPGSQDRAGGDEDLESRRGREQSREQGHAVEQALEVVEDQEHPAASEGGHEAFDRPTAGRLAQAQGRGDLAGQQSGVAHRVERDEGDPVRVLVLQPTGDLDRDPALADPAGAVHGHEPHRVVAQELGELVERVTPTDERGQLPGQCRDDQRRPLVVVGQGRPGRARAGAPPAAARTYRPSVSVGGCLGARRCPRAPHAHRYGRLELGRGLRRGQQHGGEVGGSAGAAWRGGVGESGDGGGPLGPSLLHEAGDVGEVRQDGDDHTESSDYRDGCAHMRFRRRRDCKESARLAPRQV